MNKNLNLGENESLDDLELDNLKIIQNKNGYKFSTDSVLLANFGKAKSSDKYVDLCSGSGVVAILFCWKNKIKNAYCVELQQQLSEMSQRSIELNELSGRIKVINENLKNTPKIFGYESIDVITINPPYNKLGETSTIDEIALATHEIKTNLSEEIETISKLLKFGGKLYMVHRSDRLTDILFELRKNRLEPKVIQMVYPNSKKESNLILIEAKKGASSGVKVLRPITICNDDGTMTSQLNKIYGKTK